MNVAYKGLHFANCNDVAPILYRLAEKWPILVMMVLATGPRHFNQLRREAEGISQRMLTRTLRTLERDGLVSRTVQDTCPPRVDYALTSLGESFRDPIAALGTWALHHVHDIRRAQLRYDRLQAEA